MGNVYKQKQHKPKQQRSVEDVIAYARVYGAIETIDGMTAAFENSFSKMQQEYGRELTDRERMIVVAAVMDAYRDNAVKAATEDSGQMAHWMQNCDFRGQMVQFVQREVVDDGNDEIGFEDSRSDGNRLQ